MPTRPLFPRHKLGRPVDTRPTASSRGYDTTWQRLRLAVLADEPLCRRCRAEGRVTGAEVVDHITPIVDGGDRLDRANLQPLCVPCHAIKTASDVRKRRGMA